MINVPLAQIEIDCGMQMRVAGIDIEVVNDYADAMADGATFPPVTLYQDGDVYWLTDGFHRVEAARRNNAQNILADVRQGTRRDAILAAIGANSNHGLRRSTADKRRSVETMLRDPEWSRGSDRDISKACGCDHKTVGKIRREMTGGEIPQKAPLVSSSHSPPADVADGEIQTLSGSMVERMLTRATTDALISECRRRGLEVANAA